MKWYYVEIDISCQGNISVTPQGYLGDPNHRHVDSLFNSLFILIPKNTSKLQCIGLAGGDSKSCCNPFSISVCHSWAWILWYWNLAKAPKPSRMGLHVFEHYDIWHTSGNVGNGNYQCRVSRVSKILSSVSRGEERHCWVCDRWLVPGFAYTV